MNLYLCMHVYLYLISITTGKLRYVIMSTHPDIARTEAGGGRTRHE